MTEAVTRQWELVAEHVAALPDAAFAAPSPLPGWSVADLAAHCARSINALAVAIQAGGEDQRPGAAQTDAVGYLGGVGARAEAVADTARADAAGLAPQDLRERLRAAVAAATGALAGALAAAPMGAGGPLDVVVPTPGGPARLADFLVTRAVEGVVHGIDLGLAAPDRDALRIVVRALLDLLAARAPGRSVEVRVPPFAAVQVVEGPRHTRGTPPNVVEADPVAFVQVAAGRADWAAAVADGRIHASGERADLRPYLPLL
ncbi:MAG: maleylpyruvate isomerase N-terminal domain-containing protein [Frankia sp.]|nr:maleylpyruvate isomerase N-terminal domain-containing protein [Frankia sp.]